MEFIRSLLFVPAVRPRFIEKAPESGADAVCLDLEDSVPPAEKANGRDVLREIIPTLPRTGYKLFVRVNGLDTGLVETDLDAIVTPHLDGISLPKCNNPETLRQADAYLTYLERTRGLEPGHVKILPWIETAEALIKVADILQASGRLIGASIGGEDFANDMGVMRTRENTEILFARYQVATACAYAKILAIDSPVMDFRNQELLERDASFARSIGFRAKYCIHPDQVATVNRIFSPREEEINFARKVVAAYEEGEKQGHGAVSMDGEVVDWPVYTRALAILKSAQT